MLVGANAQPSPARVRTAAWLRTSGCCSIRPLPVSRILSGSIGGRESTVQSEHVIENLTELNRIWDKLAALPEHQKWGKELEPFVVSGTNRWEVYRLL